MFSAATESLTQVDIAIFVPQYFSVIDTSFLSQTISLWLKTFSESTVMTQYDIKALNPANYNLLYNVVRYNPKKITLISAKQPKQSYQKMR